MSEIEKLVYIAAPIDRVWAALIEAGVIAHWMEDESVTSDPVVGGRYALFGGETTGQYTQVEGPTNLAYTWRQATWAKDWPDSQVRWELAVEGAGTRLKLVHSHFPNADERDGHDEGWEVYWLKPMKAWLEATGPV